MERKVVIVLGVIALLLGALTPISIDTVFRVGRSSSTITTQTQETGSPVSRPIDVGEVLSGELRTFKSYDEVADYLISLDNAKALVNNLISSWFTFGAIRVGGVALATTAVPPSPSTPSAESAKAGADMRAVRTPGTNVQVVGVDEPDMVKCDGRVLAVTSFNKVNLVGVKERKVLSTVSFKDEEVSGLFLYGDMLVVLTTKPNVYPLVLDLGLKCRCNVIIPSGTSNTTVYLYNVSSVDNPVLQRKFSITGTYSTSRMNGKYVYVITSLPISGPTIPLINGVPVMAENIAKVDVEPTAYTTVMALDVSTGSYTSYAFMTGYNSWFYMSPNNLYLVSAEGPSVLEAYNAVISALVNYLPANVASEVRRSLEIGDLMKCVDVISEYFSSLSYKEVGSLLTKVSDSLAGKVFSELSNFYMFSVKGINVSFRGRFEVAGRVLDQFSMEELGEHFIVATTSTSSVIKVRYDQPIVIVPPMPSEKYIEITECNGSRCVTKTVT
ncbi:MAG: beta-propeller domain-containing protein, partial [Sulfolobales archaeon]|nr:beta-propeller domain-containing protein [Sulfolobales archaeon]